MITKPTLSTLSAMEAITSMPSNKALLKHHTLSILLSFMLIVSVNGYKMLPNKVSFTDAQTYCERTGSKLASIHSYDDLVKVQAMCNSDASNQICWIGGIHDNTANCTYSWIDGSDWDYDPPRYDATEYCDSDQSYVCLTTLQVSRYKINTLHDCYDQELRPICNDGKYL